MLDRIVIAVVATLATTFGFVSGKSEGSKEEVNKSSFMSQPRSAARPPVAPPPPLGISLGGSVDDYVLGYPQIGPAAIAADGTIYVVYSASVSVALPYGYAARDSNLYALLPEGGVKWQLRLAGAGVVSAPAIGADGTIYVGTGARCYVNDPNSADVCVDGLAPFYAINPDGTIKWVAYEGNHAP